VVIAGDFNGADVAFLMEQAGYAWANRDAPPSLYFLRADHIFARGLAPLASGTVQRVAGASDHRPVWATFRLEAAGAPPVPAARPGSCGTGSQG
jgi:endonuclease/exonuclease/phosphatase (EEP) superfamily protein YafD